MHIAITKLCKLVSDSLTLCLKTLKGKHLKKRRSNFASFKLKKLLDFSLKKKDDLVSGKRVRDTKQSTCGHWTVIVLDHSTDLTELTKSNWIRQ